VPAHKASPLQLLAEHERELNGIRLLCTSTVSIALRTGSSSGSGPSCSLACRQGSASNLPNA
jgi:hypothetical protein